METGDSSTDSPRSNQASKGAARLNCRWLHCGRRLAVFVAAAIGLATALTISACSLIPPTDVLDYVPRDATRLWRWDMPKVLGGSAPRIFVSEVEDEIGPWLDELGIRLNEVDQIVFVESGGSNRGVMILNGSFDFEDVADKLEDLDYDDDNYRGFELWENGDGEYFSTAAFLSDERYLILGLRGDEDVVRDILIGLDGERGLFKHHSEIGLRKAVFKAERGWGVYAITDCGLDYRGCDGVAIGFADVDHGEGNVNIAISFRSATAAKRSVDNIRVDSGGEGLGLPDPLSQGAMKIEDIDVEGSFVIGTGIAYFE